MLFPFSRNTNNSLFSCLFLLDVGSTKFFRLNDEKVLKWLCYKVSLDLLCLLVYLLSEVAVI